MARILIVDDNADVRMTLREMLALGGHEVHEAGDGATGIAIARTQAPDVALIDIGLPVMDGYALAERLRQSWSGGKPVRMVAVTGYGLERDRERSARTGFTDHLVKPIELAVLDRLLKADDAGTGRAAAPT